MIAIGLGMISCSALAAGSLRDVLTADEFKRAGLEKLTPQELAFLSDRLLGAERAAPNQKTAMAPAAIVTRVSNLSAAVVEPRSEDTFGREVQIAEQVAAHGPKEIKSVIPGKFEGWSGRTRFVLANGQVWEQTDPGEFVVNLNSPSVVVRRGAFSAYYLRVEGYGAQVKVKRLK